MSWLYYTAVQLCTNCTSLENITMCYVHCIRESSRACVWWGPLLPVAGRHLLGRAQLHASASWSEKKRKSRDAQRWHNWAVALLQKVKRSFPCGLSGHAGRKIQLTRFRHWFWPSLAQPTGCLLTRGGFAWKAKEGQVAFPKHIAKPGTFRTFFTSFRNKHFLGIWYTTVHASRFMSESKFLLY